MLLVSLHLIAPVASRFDSNLFDLDRVVYLEVWIIPQTLLNLDLLLEREIIHESVHSDLRELIVFQWCYAGCLQFLEIANS